MKRFTSIFVSFVMILSLFTSFPIVSSAASYSDTSFFARFNYTANPGLAAVKEFVDDGDYQSAKEALLEYFKNRKQTSSIQGFGITSADEFYGMAVLPMRNILTGPYEFDMWQAEFTVTSSSYSDYSVDVTERIAQELNNGAVSFMLFAGDKQQYPVYVKSKESSDAPVLSVTYEINGIRDTAVITADNDTYISSANTSTTYGSDTELPIKEDGTGSNSTGNNTRRAYINFPLDQCRNSTIISAELVLNAAFASDCTTGDKDVLVINVGDTMWDEDSLTWAGTRGSIYSYQNAETPTWAASAPNSDSEYHNVTSRFWFGKPMAYEYLSYLADPAGYDAAHPYSDVYPGGDFGPKLVDLMAAFASQMSYGYTRTLETGERLSRWVDIVDAFLETDVFDTRLDEFCKILDFMWGDCNNLISTGYNNLGWSNWKLVASAGLFKAVEYIPEFSNHDSWRNTVENYITRNVDDLYNDDYSFTEAGPSYAAWCAKLLGDAINAAKMSGNPLSAVYTEKIKYIARNALESYYPNGYDTNIGDSNYRNQMHYFETLNTAFNGKDNIIASYVAGENKDADYLTNFYHNVNTAYMRNSWDPDEAVYINYTNNPSDGHYHPDSNQVIMYAYGSSLLVDSGRYSYSSTNQVYSTLRTAASHNTIEAEGATLGTHTAATSSNSLIYANTNDVFDFASSEQHGYSDVSHTRNVFFAKSGFGIVTDYVTGSASNTYRQNWHFMPSSNAEATGNVIATNFYNAPDITLAAASATSSTVRDGYHSADYGLVAKSEYGSFEKTGSTVKFDTVLYPDRANTTTAVSAVDLAETDNTKAAMEITINGEKSYYYVKNTDAANGTFGSYTTDAKMAYVADDEYMIADGKTISGKVESKSTVVSLGVTLDGTSVAISGEKLIADSNNTTAIKLYAPNAAIVTLNGEEISFTKSGDYIYAVCSTVAESITGATAKVYPDKDGFVASSNGNEGASQTTIIQAARGWQNRNAYMAFDLSGYENMEITSAKLYLTPTEVANSPQNFHFYYMDYGTWTRSSLPFVLDSSKMPTHTGNTTGSYAGFSYRWQGDMSAAKVGTTLNLTSNLQQYLAAGGNYKFTWAMLSESGSIKFHSINSTSTALRPYLELTYNYQTSSVPNPAVVVNTYLDGVISDNGSFTAPLGSIYFEEVEDVITSDDKTYYLDYENSNISTIVKKDDNVLNIRYNSANEITVTFEDILGNMIMDDDTVAISPSSSSYTYPAPESVEIGSVIYTLDTTSSLLTWNESTGDVLSAVYKKSSTLSGDNLITNGSFEDASGNFSVEGWYTPSDCTSLIGDPFTTNHFYAVSETYVVNSGTQTALQTSIPDGKWALGTRWNDGPGSGNNRCSIIRVVPVTAGKTYRISYDVKHKNGSDGGYLKTSLVADSTLNTTESNTTTPGYIGTEWTTVERTFTATEDTDNVKFYFRWLASDNGNGPNWYFDNFRIQEIAPFEYTNVTIDGKATVTEGTVELGEITNESYALPADTLGYLITSGDGDKTTFCKAGEYTISEGDIVQTIQINIKAVTGAQVRYGGGLDEYGKVNLGNGLRFIAQIDRSSITDSEAIGYGMRITAEDSDKFVDIPAENFQNGNKTIFTVAITNLNTSNYNRLYTATPYVKVRYTDNTEATIFATNSITRSIYQVAVGLLKNASDTVDGNDSDYDVSNHGLYDVLNAYINMVGVRLNLSKNGISSPRIEGEGSYTGDVFFDVSSTLKNGVYTITIMPITENFNNKVKIMDYWMEFVRINNNNKDVAKYITNVVTNPDGSVTFDFVPNTTE